MKYDKRLRYELMPKIATRLTMREAAAYLGHSYSWLHANHKLLGLPSYRIGGRWYFDLADMESWTEVEKRNQTLKKVRRFMRDQNKSKVTF